MVNTEGWQTALEVLRPLEARLDAVLSAGDVAAATRLAFSAASQAATLVAEPTGTAQATIHRVLVELTPLPLDTLDDGTLTENGVYVTLTYGSWDVTPTEAEQIAGAWSSLTGWTVDSS